MVVGSVLILTAGFGEGHNAAARNILAALRSHHRNITADIHDIYAEAHPFTNRLASGAYKFAINRTPRLWKLFYDFLDRAPGAAGGVHILLPARRRLARIATSLKPDVIVTTFPGYGPLIGTLPRTFRLVTVVTDSLTINSIWLRTPSDFLLVANEPTARQIESAGIPRDRIRVTGFPVPEIFAQPGPRTTPPADGIWKVLFMVNSSPQTAPDTVRALLQLENIALTVTYGRDEALGRKLREISESAGKPLELHGWTKEMPNLIRRSHALVGKAGGATVQECLAAATPLVITQIVPGQEEGNARLVLENGAGDFAESPEAIAQAVANLFAENGRLHAARTAAAKKLGHPAGASEAANFIASLAMQD
ncbi:MAG: MGDG synthase family glycosyltransferase [Terrimicrobiaceae bacterium]|jgi:processive 1,2-diacylglycerol beta-glucosyltransferase